MNKQIIHDALILAAFTLVLGFILALVHDITLKPLEAANVATAHTGITASSVLRTGSFDVLTPHISTFFCAIL